MRPRLLTLALVFSVACGATRPPLTAIGDAVRLERCEPATGEEPFVALELCLDDESVAAARFVASVLRGELEGVWSEPAYAAEGASRVWARSASSGPEVVLSVEQLAAVVQARGQAYGEPDPDADPLRVGFSAIEVETEGDVRTLRGVAIALPTMDDSERFGTEARLYQTEDGWSIRVLRTWPLEWSTEDERQTYDDALWARQDERVERARAALEDDDPDTRRQLVAALQSAHRYAEAREALTPLLTDPNQLDVAALADLEAALGHPEQAAAARARLEDEALPPGAFPSRLREVCRYSLSPDEADHPDEARAMLEEDPDAYYEAWERCDARVLYAGGTREQPLGLARIVRGAEERETTEFFFWDDGVWSEGIEVSEGPFNGNQTAGVMAFEVSDGEGLAADGMTGLRARYTRERVVEDVRVAERGVLFCVREVSACLLLPEQRVSTDTEGVETSRRYDVALDGDELRVRRTAGPAAADEPVGARPLRAWFER